MAKTKRQAREKFSFFLLDEDGLKLATYHTNQPRMAALKAATAGHTNIRLRKAHEDRIHVFKGFTKIVPKPKGAPTWMADKIKKPYVTKVGIIHPRTYG
jgi:hypothetical protein